jgi:hypothetical protein
MVKVYWPATTVLATLTFRTVVVTPVVMTAGEKLAVTPAGRFSTVRVTVPAKLPVRPIVAVMEPSVPTGTVNDDEESETVNPAVVPVGLSPPPPPHPINASAATSPAPRLHVLCMLGTPVRMSPSAGNNAPTVTI